jgi:transposase
MQRHEAEVLYEQGKAPVVEKLLELDAQIGTLKERIASLEKNSHNSSKPPSTDHPASKSPVKDRPKSSRKAGGQPGHKGKKRELVPPDKVDQVIDYYPDTCDLCEEKLLEGEAASTIGEPLRHQQVEIEIKTKITECRLHAAQCQCGHITRATLPPEMASSHFGPRLTAIVAYLTAVVHAPRRAVEEFCRTVMGVHLSHGTVQNMLHQMSRAVKPAVSDLHDRLPSKEVVNADETGWHGRWLWVFVTSTFVYFHIAHSRGSKVLKEVLGERFDGILGVDRWGAYSKYHRGRMQLCWAHLKRNIQGILDLGIRTGSLETQHFANRLHHYRRKLMKSWHRFKSGEITRSELIWQADIIEWAIKKHLERYRDYPQKKIRNFARNLLTRFDHLFTFVHCEGVEPTNNSAERGVRPAVQWRKICFGNKSDQGARITARLLTVARTCHFLKQNPLEFMVNAIVAYRTRKTPPLLIPREHASDQKYPVIEYLSLSNSNKAAIPLLTGTI